MKKAILTISAMVVLLSSCTETIDKKINSQNLISDLKEIQADYSSTYDSLDFAVLGVGVGFVKLMGGDKEIGKMTYRQLLDEYKENRVKEEKERAIKLAKYEKELADWKKSNQTLNNLVSFKITDKGFHVGDYGFREQLMFKYTLRNTSDKQIRAIKGGFSVYDTFGEKVGAYAIEKEQPIQIAQSISDEIYYDYNSYDGEATKVKEESLSNLKYKWETLMVIFADGSVLEPKPEPEKLDFL